MRPQRLTPVWMLVLGASLCPFLACGWLAFQFWEALPTAALQRARDRWSLRSFDHYQWRVVYRAGNDCLQDIEVQAEQVVVSYPHPETDCDIPPQTVTEFFDLVQRYIERTRCGPKRAFLKDGRVSLKDDQIQTNLPDRLELYRT